MAEITSVIVTYSPLRRVPGIWRGFTTVVACQGVILKNFVFYIGCVHVGPFEE